MAIDGSVIEMPLNSPQILEKYGAITNQTDCKKPSARSSSVFDVLNGITLDAILAPYKTSEKDLAFQHIENILKLNLQQPFLILFDRGYPSLELIIYLITVGINFVMRCNTAFLKEVNDAVVLGKKDTIIELRAEKLRGEAWKNLKKIISSLSRKACFSVRVLLIKLNTGETEILLSSLLEKTQYPYAIFKELYFKRWNIEEEYDFKKNSIEIENFSGKSCIAVEQDFHSTILVGNIHALLTYEAQNEMKKGKMNVRKYEYKVNRNVSIALLKNNLIEVLIDPGICLKGFCNSMKSLMKRNLVPIRPGRSFPRLNRHRSQKYHMTNR